MRYKLKMRRIAADLSQAQMAAQMNKDPTVWSKIEAGKTAFVDKDIARASSILNCRPEDIIDDYSVLQSGNTSAAIVIENQTIHGAGDLKEFLDNIFQFHAATINSLVEAFCDTLRDMRNPAGDDASTPKNDG